MNDLDFVLKAVDLLWSHRLRTWIVGGWGEELRGLAPPCEHRDLDLLFPAPDWRRVDELDLDWVPAARLPWKRAFSLDGTPVELYLVLRDERAWYTEFGQWRHRWPADVFATRSRLPVASRSALLGYRGARLRNTAAA